MNEEKQIVSLAIDLDGNFELILSNPDDPEANVVMSNTGQHGLRVTRYNVPPVRSTEFVSSIPADIKEQLAAMVVDLLNVMHDPNLDPNKETGGVFLGDNVIYIDTGEDGQRGLTIEKEDSKWVLNNENRFAWRLNMTEYGDVYPNTTWQDMPLKTTT